MTTALKGQIRDHLYQIWKESIKKVNHHKQLNMRKQLPFTKNWAPKLASLDPRQFYKQDLKYLPISGLPIQVTLQFPTNAPVSQSRRNWKKKNCLELPLLSARLLHQRDWQLSWGFNSLGPPVTICRGSARPACLGVAMWRPPLPACIWRAPPHGDKNIAATHRDVPSNIAHSYLLTSPNRYCFRCFIQLK